VTVLTLLYDISKLYLISTDDSHEQMISAGYI